MFQFWQGEGKTRLIVLKVNIISLNTYKRYGQKLVMVLSTA